MNLDQTDARVWGVKKETKSLMSVAARSIAWACGRSLAAIAGSNPARRHVCLSLVSVVCCQVEVSA
jgi:hypothetical protein